MQQGSLYVVGTGADSACYLKYRTTDENGYRVHKTVLLCKRDDRYDWWFKRGKWGFSSAVRDLQRKAMDKFNADAQLVMALSFFLGLRPGETAALKWEDFDGQQVHIRRSVVRGVVGTPKTPESIAPLPLLEQVRFPLQLWWTKCDKPKTGWVFPSANDTPVDTPVDLHNLVARVIRKNVDGSAYKVKGVAQECIRCGEVPSGVGKWKSIYAVRRGAGTAIVEVTNGNLAVAQALLRHKNQMTTAMFYKKAISAKAWWQVPSCWKLLPTEGAVLVSNPSVTAMMLDQTMS